jgi:predicted metal-dependent phosphoesterase TrpH
MWAARASASGVQPDGLRGGRKHVIDLHLHTTASDGCCSAEELVSRAFQAGIDTLAVTDHDTVAAVSEAAGYAVARGMTLVPGIEITAVDNGCDVHVLGYFIDPDSSDLAMLVGKQREERLERAREISGHLSKAGAPIDEDLLFGSLGPGSGKTIARPQIARALIAAGHVASVAEAFDRYLSEGRPAYVPHRGPGPTQVVEIILRAGGIASLAHPGPLRRDHLIPTLVESGLGAIEAYHSDHDLAAERRYLDLARKLDLGVTGGSDYHGNGRARDAFFGVTHLPSEEFLRLTERLDHATI